MLPGPNSRGPSGSGNTVAEDDDDNDEEEDDDEELDILEARQLRSRGLSLVYHSTVQVNPFELRSNTI